MHGYTWRVFGRLASSRHKHNSIQLWQVSVATRQAAPQNGPNAAKAAEFWAGFGGTGACYENNGWATTERIHSGWRFGNSQAVRCTCTVQANPTRKYNAAHTESKAHGHRDLTQVGVGLKLGRGEDQDQLGPHKIIKWFLGIRPFVAYIYWFSVPYTLLYMHTLG